MNKELCDYLAGGTKLLEVPITWGKGTMPMQLTYYLAGTLPPAPFISSARALVFRGDSVLVVKEANDHLYILPGGRVEKGDSPMETLTREILEETGWMVDGVKLLGLMHFRHLGDKPVGYRYPYPDFVWPVYVVEAVEFTPEALQPDDYVSESGFRPVKEVRKLPLDEGELMFLESALALRVEGDTGDSWISWPGRPD